jgi:streptomycin 6-kinase
VAEVVIPAKLAATVVDWEGDSGRAWLMRLPGLIAEVSGAWDLELHDPFEPGGNISWVAPARRRGDGAEAVLKLQHPHPESDAEAVALAVWRGAGAVRLLAHDRDRRALLLERCRPGSPLGGEPDPYAAARVAAALGARLHTVSAPPALPTLAVVQRAWADELEDRLSRHPVSDHGLARHALVTMRRRPDACAHPVVLHGDLNPTNVLAASREPWLAIDPKPMLGDAAYDGSRLVAQPDPLRAGDPGAVVAGRLDLVADGLGVDRALLAEWCLVAAVEMAVSAIARGDRETSARCEAHTALVAAHLP